jgi:hypothetical protein
VRTEECVCGGPPISSETLKGAGIHVAVHNADPVHISWRRVRQAVEAHEFERDRSNVERLVINRDLRRQPTAGTNPRDLSGSKPGASAGVEGAA